MKTQVLAAVALIAGVALAAVVATLVVLSPDTTAAPPAQSPSHVLPVATAPTPLAMKGKVRLKNTFGTAKVSDDLKCSGVGAYADIVEDAQVVVTDVAGHVIGLGKLDFGYFDVGGCTFPFEVAGLPGGGQFYGVQVASRERLQFTAERLASPVEVKIGF